MEELAVLIARARAGEREAREVLIEKNLGLVRHIVRRFMGRGCDAEDLFQIGTIGLMKAIDKFDVTLGLQFSTYAVPVISGEIKRFLRDDGPIKVSRTIKENSMKISQARQKLQTKEQREPTLSELSGATGISAEDIVIAIEASTEVESIYSAVYQDDGSEIYLVDRLSGDKNEKEQVLNRLLVAELMGQLNTEERKLIGMRYFQNMTQTQVASVLGISQVQVSRLEKKILLRLRECVKE